jgi:uncharacterized protein (DUF433 family)
MTVSDGDTTINAVQQYDGGMSRLDRITTEASVCHGKPVIRGLRYPVQILLEGLASGMSIEEVLADYADLQRDDLLAALAVCGLDCGWPSGRSPRRHARSHSPWYLPSCA